MACGLPGIADRGEIAPYEPPSVSIDGRPRSADLADRHNRAVGTSPENTRARTRGGTAVSLPNGPEARLPFSRHVARLARSARSVRRVRYFELGLATPGGDLAAVRGRN
jgi:hypothetical protein